MVSSSFCKHTTLYGILLPAFVQSDRGETRFCFCNILRNEMLRNVFLTTKIKNIYISESRSNICPKKQGKFLFQITRKQYSRSWHKCAEKADFAKGILPRDKSLDQGCKFHFRTHFRNGNFILTSTSPLFPRDKVKCFFFFQYKLDSY